MDFVDLFEELTFDFVDFFFYFFHFSAICLALPGLCWCMNFSYGEWGLLSSCGILASHCSGFCYCRAPALGHESFSSCGTWALVAV